MATTKDEKVDLEVHPKKATAESRLTNGTAVAVSPSWDPAVEKALVRKVDLRIFPVMVTLFILNFIDRNNFANARLRGLEDDLSLSDVEYQTCISILLVGYVAMQIPSNMILNKLSRPSWYLSGCVAVWGLISAATGAVHNFTGAVICRFFLGCAEASFFPGSLLFLSRWYTRSEMQLRVTILNVGNLAAQGFGGLIAAGILENMQGSGGLAAWRWLFIIEGAITIALAIVAIFILPDYPSSTSWLNEEQKLVAENRLAFDNGLAGGSAEDEDVTAIQGLVLACKDIKVWILGLTYHTTIMGLSFVFFFPTITQALGYDRLVTLLLTAPPWIFAMCVALPNAWHADKTGERFLHYIGPALTCIVGYIISATTTTTAPRYVAMFMMTVGFASGFVLLAWISNTIPRPAAKKAAAIALVNAMGNIGSIPGSYIWPAKYGPYYVNSFAAEMALLGFASICALVLRFYLRAQNKRLDQQDAMRRSSEGGGSSNDESTEVSGAKAFRYLY